MKTIQVKRMKEDRFDGNESCREKFQIRLISKNALIRESWKVLIDMESDLLISDTYASFEEAFEDDLFSHSDILIMDLGQNEENNYRAISYVRKSYPGLLILIVAITGDGDKLFRAIQAGANGYLLKSWKPDDIIQAIRSGLDKKAFMTAEFARFIRTKLNTHSFVIEPKLNESEWLILNGLTQGKSYLSLSRELFTPVDEILTHIRKIYFKLSDH